MFIFFLDPNFFPLEVYLAQKYNFYWKSSQIYVIGVLFQLYITIILSLIQYKGSLTYEYERFFRRPDLHQSILRNEEENNDQEVLAVQGGEHINTV